ncbi:S8 family serine peptidase [Asanoa sp. NPDC049518]|uniref:S8 family serine peptidase n=1 Tax=unclassified Asanoa TaxID=2685164 RepID=UPI0034179EA3
MARRRRYYRLFQGGRTAPASFGDGTSFSTPDVSGAGARYLAYHPRAGPAHVRRAIVKSGNEAWIGDRGRLLHHL